MGWTGNEADVQYFIPIIQLSCPLYITEQIQNYLFLTVFPEVLITNLTELERERDHSYPQFASGRTGTQETYYCSQKETVVGHSNTRSADTHSSAHCFEP